MKSSNLRSLAVVILIYIALALFLFMTDPRKLPLVMLMVPFALFFAAVYLSVRLIILKFLPNIGQRKRLIIAACVAGVPSFLLLLSSVNQLTWRDVALVSFLMIALLFYNSRASFFKK